MSKHMMVDIETLGTDPDSAFISIGAVLFTDREVLRGQQFYREVDPDPRASYSMDTIRWWAKQDGAARSVLTSTGVGELEALTAFREFWNTNRPVSTLWSNGPTFDEMILRSGFKRQGLSFPFAYYRARDCRTLKMLATRKGWKAPDFRGTPHHALHDAIYQAECAVEQMRILS